MITINLKPGARRQAPKGDALAAARERFTAIGAQVRDPALAIAIGAWVAVILVVGFLYLRSSSRLNALEPQLQQSESEYHRYHAFVVQKRQAEKVRDSILTQIGTISSVDARRYTWSHILDDVASALPMDTWLTSITPAIVANNAAGVTDSTLPVPVTVVIAGETNDLQNYTSFLRRLGESHWLTDVLPVKTATVIDNNRAMTTFTVQVTYTRADSSQIRTVPVLESTVR